VSPLRCFRCPPSLHSPTLSGYGPWFPAIIVASSSNCCQLITTLSLHSQISCLSYHGCYQLSHHHQIIASSSPLFPCSSTFLLSLLPWLPPFAFSSPHHHHLRPICQPMSRYISKTGKLVHCNTLPCKDHNMHLDHLLGGTLF
jgi:hypothetical protein